MIKTEGVVSSDGKLHLPYVGNQLLSFAGSKVEVVIDEKKDPVSLNQHGYYRALNKWLSEKTIAFGGWLVEDIHDFARGLFLYEVKVFKITHPTEGETIYENKALVSTSSCGKKKMSAFITQWRDWLLYEQNIETPEAEHFQIKPATELASTINIDDKLQ